MNIVSTFTTAVTDFATGIGTTVVDLFDKVFTNGEGGLSNLAIWGITFGAVSLVLGLVHTFTRKAG